MPRLAEAADDAMSGSAAARRHREAVIFFLSSTQTFYASTMRIDEATAAPCKMRPHRARASVGQHDFLCARRDISWRRDEDIWRQMFSISTRTPTRHQLVYGRAGAGRRQPLSCRHVSRFGSSKRSSATISLSRRRRHFDREDDAALRQLSRKADGPHEAIYFRHARSAACG